MHLLRVPRDPRRSLLLRTMILRSADGATVPEEGMVAMAALSDDIAASVRWWHAADDAAAWFESVVSSVDEQHRDRVATAAMLASATIVVAEDVAPPADAAAARDLVVAAGGQEWEPQVVEIELGAHRGFRVSCFAGAPAGDETSDPDGLPMRTSTITAVDTTSVLDVAGRLGVAALSPAEPQTAAVAAALLEPALASLRLGGAAPASEAGGTA